MTAAAQECPGPDWLAGRALLDHHANTGRIFTSNDIRADLRDLVPAGETVHVPVQRDRGRFASGRPGFEDVPLPMEVGTP